MSFVLLRPSSSSLPSRLTFLLFFLLVNLYYLVKSASNSFINDKCMTCKFLSKTFLEGLEKTEKLHFGGGNTDWEERNLGRFKTSETRFVEILDYVCKKDSSAEIGFSGIKDLQFKCHSLLEAHEELLGQWFFEHQDNGPTLGKYLCIENLKLCCDEGYFGADCSPCPGMKLSGKPCFGNGQCQGNGTRNGNGTCSCHAGYVGKMCSNCDSSYFAVSQNSSYIECEVVALVRAQKIVGLAELGIKWILKSAVMISTNVQRKENVTNPMKNVSTLLVLSNANASTGLNDWTPANVPWMSKVKLMKLGALTMMILLILVVLRQNLQRKRRRTKSSKLTKRTVNTMSCDVCLWVDLS
ncbi:hypothetical protein niasHS_012207 [Heterodera schachtii]|uniref:EGF-like domain-containing protein n=1 Tax=Heterodera schachtii TaxID=97005 RepID=A0ABD2IJ23_HETSC